MSALKDIASEYWANRPMELAAALSYYTLLSLAPVVLMTVALAGLVFERVTVEGKVVAELRDLIGDSGAEVARTILHNASRAGSGALSVAIGAVVLLVGATSVFAQLQSSLNRIWKVEASPRESAVWGVVKQRLLSLAMVLAVGFLLLVSLLASAALTALGDSAGVTFHEPAAMVRSVNALLSLAGITLLFAMMFKVLPDTAVAWGDVWFGAVTTSMLFALGKYFIGLYLGRASIGSAYGAAGSLVVVTVWVYYASMIMFFGAELAYMRSRRRAQRAGGCPLASAIDGASVARLGLGNGRRD